MDLQWMLLLMVLVCSEAQNVTEVKAELGQNLTLTCSFNLTDIYWYMEVHHKLRASIGRSYSPTSSSFSSPDFDSKYLISENRLVVKDVSAEDFRRYVCGKKISGSMVYGDTFRLVSDVPAEVNSSSLSNHTEIVAEWQKKPVVVASFSLNVFFALAL
ncbi:hypothetical protein AMECASPLE_035304, partial [Ameca splendens]